MRGWSDQAPVVTGIGITSSVGSGREAVLAALLEGRHAFGVMRRPGRCAEGAAPATFIGAEIGTEPPPPATVSRRTLRTASLTARIALATLDEAWQEARLADVDPERVGLIVGGSNLQQRELVLTYDNRAGKAAFVRPSYGLSFMDTDLCGMCTEEFGIRGPSFTVGGASASGTLAVIQAAQAVRSGQLDVCIALGALMDLSFWECHALRGLGAMGSDRFAAEPGRACRPFDEDRDGFIFGENCAALVIERVGAAPRSGVRPYAALSGWAAGMDANRNPDPSLAGEVSAITRALAHAGLAARDIDYVNAHGTGSALGDETELRAIRECGLDQAYINASKSVMGHGLSAAGAVEIAATLLQMRAGRLHPTRNLENPIGEGLRWVRHEPAACAVNHALKLSMGFGGFNAAVCLSRCEPFTAKVSIQ